MNFGLFFKQIEHPDELLPRLTYPVEAFALLDLNVPLECNMKTLHLNTIFLLFQLIKHLFEAQNVVLWMISLCASSTQQGTMITAAVKADFGHGVSLMNRTLKEHQFSLLRLQIEHPNDKDNINSTGAKLKHAFSHTLLTYKWLNGQITERCSACNHSWDLSSCRRVSAVEPAYLRSLTHSTG